MGAWGAGGFENDTAMDFVAGMGSAKDLAAFLSGCLPEDPVEEIDTDRAEQIIAAAECVAVMTGRPSADLPGDLGAKLASFGDPDPRLVEAAREAVSSVLSRSELTELWAEGDPAPFNRAVISLIDRLNPQISYETPAGSDPTEVRQTCGFCGGDIEPAELFSIEINQQTDPTDVNLLNRGFWCHLDCLNVRLHPRHIIQDWKFVPEANEEEAKRLIDC